MSDRKKILFLVSRIPYPLEKGDKLRAYHLIKNLSVKHDVYLFALSDSALNLNAEKELKKVVKEIFYYKISKFSILNGLFLGLFSKFPFQVGYFFNSGAHLLLQKIVKQVKPDHIFTQLIRMSEYVKNINNIPKSLDYMDSFSKGMERRKNKAKGVKKWLINLEQKKLKLYETSIFPFFDYRFIISDQDLKTFEAPLQSGINVLPNGVDDEFFSLNKTIPKSYDFVFTGNMSYPPNVDAVEFIVKDILPLIWKKYPNANLLIAGASPSNVVQSLSSSRVEVTGWVDDIRDAYNKGRIFLAPLRIGSGLQNKLLEAMCMEIPCVTSPLANNALKAQPDKDILIAESAEEFAEKAILILENKELSKSISASGKKFIQKNYNWKKVTNNLEAITKIN